MRPRLLRRNSMTGRPGRFTAVRIRVVFETERVIMRPGVNTLRRMGSAA